MRSSGRKHPCGCARSCEGVVLLPQDMFILKKAPHPKAAKPWIDLILSEHKGGRSSSGAAMTPRRDGFVRPLPDYAPGTESLKPIPIDKVSRLRN